MTTTAASPTRTDAPSRNPLLAALGLGVALLLTAIAFFWDITGNDGDKDPHAMRGYLVTAAILVVLTALVFVLVVRTAPGQRAGKRSAILGVVAALSILVFWSGAPTVFATAAIAAALTERDDTGRFGKGSKAGLALAAVTVVAAVVAAIIG